MFKSLRTKLLVGIAPLLAIMLGLGLWAVVMFLRLGGNIDVILRENYESVLAAENMKESLERMDSSFLFVIGGEEARGKEQFAEYKPLFERSFEKERKNITIHPREDELVAELTELRGRYFRVADRFFQVSGKDRNEMYFADLLPIFNRIKDRANDILLLNQGNMQDMDQKARTAAKSSVRWMAAILIASALVASLIALVLSQSILRPILAVTAAARAMSRGDLEQVVPVVSKDELGELAATFNSMARTLREYAQSGTARLVRAQKTAQATIDAFPDPVVVVDPSGSVERANPAARKLLGTSPVNGAAVAWTPPSPLRSPLQEVLRGDPDFVPTSLDHAICLRDDGHEKFLLPRVLAIRDEEGHLMGAAAVMTDVTRFRMLDQLKSDMVSTVSHELKTPLTSVQMAVHLLLEETVGPLNPKQVELLMAARQESDRLLAMVNDLLDLTRIEQGRVKLALEPLAPADLVSQSVERFAGRARDRGVSLAGAVAFGLPPVAADRERIAHVFDNLIGNAIEHTPRSGSIRVSAVVENHAIRFLVKDTGEGIASSHLSHVFERFYRVPSTQHRTGAGLGLAIAREIVLAHNGEIDVKSDIGIGTCFSFTIPVANKESLPSKEALS